MTIEEHPLEPFLPEKARVLFLGSFPPPKARWSMEFFYPNWINDFWRIMGLIHFGDKGYFEQTPNPLKGGYEDAPNAIKAFDKERIVAFCKEKGIALFDTARVVRRLKDNADDNFLEIVEGTDVFALLEQMPECKTIVTTGGKASEELQAYFAKSGIDVKIPKVGESIWLKVDGLGVMDSTRLPKQVDGSGLKVSGFKVQGSELMGNKPICWWRMPSTSRAYPMKLDKKAEYYRMLWRSEPPRPH